MKFIEVIDRSEINEDSDHVYVAPSGSGKFYVAGSSAVGRGAEFLHGHYDNWESAREFAKTWAQNNGLAIVYVVVPESG